MLGLNNAAAAWDHTLRWDPACILRGLDKFFFAAHILLVSSSDTYVFGILLVLHGLHYSMCCLLSKPWHRFLCLHYDDAINSNTYEFFLWVIPSHQELSCHCALATACFHNATPLQTRGLYDHDATSQLAIIPSTVPVDT